MIINNNTMINTHKTLRAVCVAALAVTLALAVVYELDLLPTGVYSCRCDGSEYIMQYVMDMLTLCMVPLSLRLFRFETIGRRLTTPQALLQWGLVRLAMLCVPMIVDTFLYYAYLNVSFGYLAIIHLLCLMFVWPTKTRCQSELKSGGQ